MSKQITLFGPEQLNINNTIVNIEPSIISGKVIVFNSANEQVLLCNNTKTNHITLFNNNFYPNNKNNIEVSFINDANNNVNICIYFKDLIANKNIVNLVNNKLTIKCINLDIHVSIDNGNTEIYKEIYKNGGFEFILNDKSVKQLEKFLVKLAKE